VRGNHPEHHNEAFVLVLRKFVSALQRNYADVQKELAQKSKPVTANKPEKRKAIRLN